MRAYPLALGLFSDLTTQVGLHFLIAYPTQQAAQAIIFPQFADFCHSHHYTQVKRIGQRFAHLQKEAAPSTVAVILAAEEQIPTLASLLLAMVQQKRELLSRVKNLFLTHCDHHIFASLPGAGDLLAPKLLVMFGEHRDRFPEAESIQSLAGTCPITIQSGKKKTVLFPPWLSPRVPPCHATICPLFCGPVNLEYDLLQSGTSTQSERKSCLSLFSQSLAKDYLDVVATERSLR